MAGAVEETDCISADRVTPLQECPGYEIKAKRSFSLGNLGNVECPFITIAPRSTLTRNSGKQMTDVKL